LADLAHWLTVTRTASDSGKVVKRAQDWHQASVALRAARTAAGFFTAASAAAHFGWPEASYRAHESGSRIPSDSDLGRYATAFHVSKAQLLDPDWSRVGRQFEEARKPILKARAELAKRLRTARILFGLPTSLNAAKHLGVAKATYAKHESGENGVKQETLAYYARSFGVSVEWLKTGARPSGFGDRLDDNIQAVLKTPEDFIQIRQFPISEGDEENIALPTGRRASRLKIPEYSWGDIENHFGDISAARPVGLCEFPIPHSAGTSKCFAVIVDFEGGQFKLHSRLFVSPSSHVDRDAEYLIGTRRRMAVVPINVGRSTIPQADVIIGRVIGKLEPLITDEDQSQADREADL
jgi:transcriptional regulator with XRE-family HTH domain